MIGYFGHSCFARLNAVHEMRALEEPEADIANGTNYEKFFFININ
jgi:hypothetical protein